MTFRSFCLVPLAIAGALALQSCSQSADKTADATTTTGTAPAGGAKKALKVTLIAKSSTNPVFLSARSGAEDAAKDLKAKTGVDVTIDWQTPSDEDAQVQAQNIQNAVNTGTDAILLSCSDATKVTSAIDDAVAKGIPVMTFDSDAADSKRFAFYGADDVAVGTQVMDELGAQMGGKGTVAILAGNQNAPNLQRRAQAVRDEAAKKFPGITILKDTVYHKETAQDATIAVQDEMKANPQISGWAMVGGWPLFATSLLTDLNPSKVKVVAVDALPAELAYVDKGIAPILLAQPTYLWGYVPVNMIFDKIINHKDPAVMNPMPLVKVDKDHLGQWAQ